MSKPPELKIKRIDVFQLDMPYSGGIYYLSVGREYPSFGGTFVRITAEDGIEGWGESTPFGSNFIASHALSVRVGIAEIAPKLIGQDPRGVNRINDIMDDTLLGHEHAKAALDIACWDIFGKWTNLPVCELLGGRTDTKLPIITSLPVREPGGMLALVDEYRAKGSRGFSVKISGDPVIDAASITEALKDKKPDEWFVVDANGGLTVEGINLKVQMFGGLTKARRVRDLCLAAGYIISVQETCGSDIGFAPLVHLSQTIPEHSLRCVLASRHMLTVKTADAAFDIIDGYVVAPTVPGLGITPRLDVLGDPVASYF
ncbi:mandelate racemase/muconate lactonizing enzyme family protein [Aspergillus affinis]|uniref:mandelate racemase/muconate lactonizing enzyme family protein n=1 Tax=Aspergillus affinis TaxID=1070780 RepID=UPI0022FEA472|nr:uncharacterized protein KD926_001806 [Aspergillus affinis]KAI9036463.1 hypothetical protein KD926_001806 [Aspergillus affinis]